MSKLDRIKLWWWRRGLHPDCVWSQTLTWHNGVALAEPSPLGACTACMPRMKKIRALFTPVARSLP